MLDVLVVATIFSPGRDKEPRHNIVGFPRKDIRSVRQFGHTQAVPKLRAIGALPPRFLRDYLHKWDSVEDEPEVVNRRIIAESLIEWALLRKPEGGRRIPENLPNTRVSLLIGVSYPAPPFIRELIKRLCLEMDRGQQPCHRSVLIAFHHIVLSSLTA